MNRQRSMELALPVGASQMKATTGIGRRMKAVRKALSISQVDFAAAVGGSERGIQDNETRNTVPGGDVLAGMSRLGINVNWLLTGDGEMLVHQHPHAAINKNTHSEYIAIPLYSNVMAAAGHGSVIGAETPDDALMFKEEWVRLELGARPADLCLIRVSGDSMEPTLRAGDVILIDIRASNPDREGIYIIRMDGMLLVKRIQALPGGNLKVTSDNPAFEPWQLKRSEIDGLAVAIVGRVVWSGRRL